MFIKHVVCAFNAKVGGMTANYRESESSGMPAVDCKMAASIACHGMELFKLLELEVVDEEGGFGGAEGAEEEVAGVGPGGLALEVGEGVLGAVLTGDVEGPFAGGGGGGDGDMEPFAGGDFYELDFAVGAGGELAFLPAEVGAVAEVEVFAAHLEEPISAGLGHDIELGVEGAGVPGGGVDVEDGIVAVFEVGGVLDFEATL